VPSVHQAGQVPQPTGMCVASMMRIEPALKRQLVEMRIDWRPASLTTGVPSTFMTARPAELTLCDRPDERVKKELNPQVGDRSETSHLPPGRCRTLPASSGSRRNPEDQRRVRVSSEVEASSRSLRSDVRASGRHPSTSPSRQKRCCPHDSA